MLHPVTDRGTGKRGIGMTAKWVRYRQALLVVFLLIAISIPMGTNVPHVAAAAGATLTIASVSGLPGQQVQVPVSVDTGGVAISGLQVNLGYDGATLTSPVGSAGPMLPESWTFQSNSPSPGDMRFLAIDLSGEAQALSGVVFTVAFTISADATAGDVPVDVALVTMHDGSGVALDVTANSGIVTVVVNQPPAAEAGPDITIISAFPATGSLNASASNDDLPNPTGSLSFAWSLVSGPGPVTFSDSEALSSLVTVPEPGTYVIRLTVSDGQFSAFDDLTITAQRLYGDASLTGTFGIPDVLLVIDWLIGRLDQPAPGVEAFLATDVDGDSLITISDVIWMIHKLVGKIELFPVETPSV